MFQKTRNFWFSLARAEVFRENIRKTAQISSSVPRRETGSQRVKEAVRVQAMERMSTATFIWSTP